MGESKQPIWVFAAVDPGFRQAQILLSELFVAKNYPVERLGWFPQPNGVPDDPRTVWTLEHILGISRGSWRGSAQLVGMIKAAANKIPDFASFQRLQALRRVQQNPRYRVNPEQEGMAGSEYKSRAVAAVQEVQKSLPGVIFTEQAGIQALDTLQTKIRNLVAGFSTLTGKQIAKSLSIIQQYLANAVEQQNFVQGENRQQILTHNTEVLNRFRTLTEALGYDRRGNETQRT